MVEESTQVHSVDRFLFLYRLVCVARLVVDRSEMLCGWGGLGLSLIERIVKSILYRTESSVLEYNVSFMLSGVARRGPRGEESSHKMLSQRCSNCGRERREKANIRISIFVLPCARYLFTLYFHLTFISILSFFHVFSSYRPLTHLFQWTTRIDSYICIAKLNHSIFFFFIFSTQSSRQRVE